MSHETYSGTPGLVQSVRLVPNGDTSFEIAGKQLENGLGLLQLLRRRWPAVSGLVKIWASNTVWAHRHSTILAPERFPRNICLVGE